MKALLVPAAAALLALAPVPAAAGPIENACNRSGRAAATRSLCRCIDHVARQTLTRSEQRRASRFFSNPDEAQSVRMSRSPADREFWARYRAFGAAAEQFCRS